MKISPAICLLLITILIMGKEAISQPQLKKITDTNGNVYLIKILPDNTQWLATNLNIQIEDSWCYDDNPENCKQYGRLYTFDSALKACPFLGEEWRLPTNQEWEAMVQIYGGVRDRSTDDGKAAFKALIAGGESGFDILFGGNREADGKSYTRLNAHGFYWTATANADWTAWFYNLGANGKIVNRHGDGDRQEAVSVRCIRHVENKKK